MTRMQGVESHQAGLFIRLMYWLVQRKIGQITGKKKLIDPIKIAAHHPRLLKALGQMEMGHEAARAVSATLKSLASIKAATLVGCPY